MSQTRKTKSKYDTTKLVGTGIPGIPSKTKEKYENLKLRKLPSLPRARPSSTDSRGSGKSDKSIKRGYTELLEKGFSRGNTSLDQKDSRTSSNKKPEPKERQPEPRKDEEFPASQRRRLLDRHPADHKYSQIQVSRQNFDLVDALNNVAGENKENEICFSSPWSSVMGKELKNAAFLSTSSVMRKRCIHDADRWVTSNMRSERFSNEGVFGAAFRLPFNLNEEKAIVRFFLDKGGYHLRKGNKIWKSMEAHNICPNRTWQSMKARWDKFLSKNLAKYKVTEADLTAADRRIYGDIRGDPSSSTFDDTDRRHDVSASTTVQRRPYTREEDITIIKHLLQSRRYLEVKGREMWEVSYCILSFVEC